MTEPDRLDRWLESLARRPVIGPPARFCHRRREQLLYLVVGAWNTLFGYCIWALMQYLLGDHIYYLFIYVLAWVPAVLNAYICYRVFVFRSHGKVWRELPRFSLVYVGTLCLGLVVLPILLRVLPFSIYVTNALFTAVMVIASYLSHKYFSFRGGQKPPTVRGVDHDGAEESPADASSHDGDVESASPAGREPPVPIQRRRSWRK